MSVPDPAVALEHVSKRYAAQLVVDDVSVEIGQGEFFTLLGPSGSGKSTTLAMIAGFTQPDAGTVWLGGREVTRLEPQVRGLGMVFQNYAIFPHLTVFENVAFPLRARRVGRDEVRARVAEALEMVKLTGMDQRYRRQLSGGQQQRVALARAIVAHPSVVLMDEPLGALDKNLRYHMQTEIKDIQRRLRMTVVFVTHDQDEAMALSDRIAIMDAGRIVQAGPPRAVYEQPGSEFVARFLGEANLIEGVAQGTVLRTTKGDTLQASNGIAGPAKLFVRPEKIGLADPDAPDAAGSNRLRGEVTRVTFLGTIVRTELAIASASKLLIDQVNGPQTRIFAEGQSACAQWPIAASSLLPA